MIEVEKCGGRRRAQCWPRQAGLVAAGLALTLSCRDQPTRPLDQTPASLSIAPNAATLADIGATQQLAVTARTASGVVVAGIAVTWSSADSTIVTVDNSGVLRATGFGSTTVQATAVSLSASATVTVLRPVAVISVTPSTVWLFPDDTISLRAEARDSKGGLMPAVQLTWNSATPSVAQVNAAGRVTAVAAGEAQVSASVGTRSASSRVSVAGLPPNVRRLACGELIQASIAVPGEVDLYAFAALQEQIDLLSLANTSGIVVGAEIVDGSGARIDQHNANGVKRVRFGAGGLYTIRVSTALPTATAVYNIGRECLLPTGPVDAHLNGGDLRQERITVAGEVDVYSLTAPANARILLPVATTGGVVVDAFVVGPDGTQVDAFRASAVRRLTLRNPGRYLVYLRTATTVDVGQYSIGLEFLSPLGGVESALSAGDLVPGGVLAPGEVDLFSFEANAGDHVLIPFATTGGLVTDATLMDPSGAVLATFRAHAAPRLTLPSTGTHLIYVHAALLHLSGTFNVGLERLRPLGPVDATLGRGLVRTDSLTMAGEVDIFTLDGVAGSRALITLVSTRGLQVSGVVIGPSLSQVATLQGGSTLDFTFGESGRHLVLVTTATFGGTARYNLGVQ